MATIRLKFVNGFNNKHRKSMAPRYYFRRPGCRAIPLPGCPGSEEFMVAYTALLATVPTNNKLEIGAKRTGVGSIDALVAMFYKSTHWTNLSPQSQQTYAPIIEKFRARHGRLHVYTLLPKHVGMALDEVAKPSAKRKLLKALRLLMRAAIPSMRDTDPTFGIKVTMPRSKGWHSWTDDEIAAYRAHWPLGSEARLVLEFALETTSRRSEVVRLGPQHVRNGKIKHRADARQRQRHHPVDGRAARRDRGHAEGEALELHRRQARQAAHRRRPGEAISAMGDGGRPAELLPLARAQEGRHAPLRRDGCSHP
jgi:hypothetical protein